MVGASGLPSVVLRAVQRYRELINRWGGDGGDGDGDGRRKGLVVLIPRTDCIRTTEIVFLAAAVGIMGFALEIRFGGRR